MARPADAASTAAEGASSPMGKPSPAEIDRQIAQGAFESWDAEALLRWGIEHFHPRLALTSSFGAPEGMVLLHLMHQIEPESRVFVLDTGRLPQETHDLIDRVRDRYGKVVEVIVPRADDVAQMVRSKGMNLFYESLELRQWCCRVRKVEPMRRALRDVDAYVTGLRREQAVTREDTAKVVRDDTYGGILKLNPIADWSDDRVWQTVRRHDIPVNRLHARGYPSVGCAPCSRAVAPGDDPRSGRWWWENPETRECGLHVDEEDQGSGI